MSILNATTSKYLTGLIDETDRKFLKRVSLTRSKGDRTQSFAALTKYFLFLFSNSVEAKPVPTALAPLRNLIFRLDFAW